ARAFWYVPSIMQPTVTYHQVIGNRVEAVSKLRRRPRLPFEVELDGIGPARVNLRTRLFPPNVVSMTLSVEPFRHLELAELIDVQQLAQRPPLADLVEWTAALVGSL